MKARPVKVKRAALIAAVEGRMRKLEAEHKRAVEAYPEKVSAHNDAVVKALRKALAAAENGRLPQSIYGTELRVPCGSSLPDKPSKRSREACKLERVLKTLKIGAEDTVMLSPDEADIYFGPCSV